MNKLRSLIEGLQLAETVNPNAEPWAYQDNIVIGPVFAGASSDIAQKFERLGWERADEEICGEDYWGFYVKG